MANATEEDYISEYRRLYWEANELRIIATPYSREAAKDKERMMDTIISILGYVPVA